MNEFMELLRRLTLACESIATSLNSANKQPIESASVKPNGRAGVGITPKEQAPQSQQRRPSELHDLSLVSPEILERSRAAQVTFAIDGMLVPWSEAHMRALKDYERKVDAEFGEGSSEGLPWRRIIPRGEETQR